MKTFNPTIFTENSLSQINETRDIVMNETKLISLLECEEYGLIQELNARRDYYIDIIENADLEVYNEAVGGKVIAAIIAIIVAIIGAIIAMISGKGGGSSGGGSSRGGGTTGSSSKNDTSHNPPSNSSPSVNKSNNKQETKPKKSSNYDSYNTDNKHLSTNDFYSSVDGAINNKLSYTEKISRRWMPMITKSTRYKEKTGKVANIDRPVDEWFKAFSYVANSVSADITEYEFPNEDTITGNLKSIQDINDVCNELNNTIKMLIDEANDSDDINNSIYDSNIEKMNNMIESISENIQNIKTSGDESNKRVNVGSYLSNIPGYINQSNPYHKYNDYIFLTVREFKPSQNVIALQSNMHSIAYYANRLPNEQQHANASKYTSKLISIANKLKSVCIAICNKIKVAFNNYFSTAEKDAKQRENLSIMISDELLCYTYNHHYTDMYNPGGFSQNDLNSLYYMMYKTNPRQQDSVQEANEFIDIDDINFNKFYNEMNETIGRYNVRHVEYQIRAVNEEALIFASESTDIEKFNKLKAVNESIGNKIKRAFYNTIAKLKEIFAKFMEKLRGNFTTTKNYLDKYKDIILKKPFKNNNNYKTQDLVLGISRIMKSEVPQLDLAGMNETLDNQDAFFKSVYTKVPNGTSEYKDNMDQATFWKTYFCMQGHDKEYTGTMFQQQALKECYEFLYDIRKTENTIKKSIKDIDDTITRVMKQAGADVNKPEEEPKKESVVWSYLYQKAFILENGILHEFEQVSNASNNQTNKTKEGVKTVSKTPEGEEDPDNIGTAKKSQRPVMDTRCNNYAIVCSNMLKAKMSACEFIRSESMGIIRAHVQSYLGQTAVKDGEEKKPEENKEETKNDSIEERNKRAQEYIDRVEKRRK